MTAYEKAEIRRLPKKYRPMSAVAYIFYSILYSIPLIGWIVLIANASSGKKICRRSYARSYLFVAIVTIIAVGAAVAVLMLNKDLMVTVKDMVIDLLNKLPA